MPHENREIRVFISSTFSDMREEREYLNTKVFPELRRICQQRSVVFTEVDLQWGIDEDKAKQGGAVEICLEEINRCHPYFIGILGERYGWSPEDDKLSVREEGKTYTPQDEALLIAIANEELRGKVGAWVTQGESVTAMEIIHGVLDSDVQAKFSYFYFRDKAFTETLLTQAEVDKSLFFETNDKKNTKLEDLKTCIRAQEKPWHVCEVFGSSQSGYASIEPFGEKVKADLLKIINEKFPEDKAPNALEKERSFHAAFARSHLESYIPNEDAFKNIFNHIQTQDSPLLVTGKMGSGKSALLANFVQRWKQKQQDGMVIEHYAGSGGEADVLGVLRRVMNEIKQTFNIDEDIPTQPDDVFRDFASWLFKVDQPLLLILDGLNQFHGDIKRLMYALPQQLGEHVRIVLSALDGEALDIANERKWKAIQIAALTQDKRKQLVEEYLAKYNKSLGSDLADALINSDMGDNPLFLRVVMDELRVDATHDVLEKMLKRYLNIEDLVGLFNTVLARCERVYPKSNVHVIMALIYTSRYGLSETELRELCGKSSNHPVAPLYISQLIFGLGGYLADREGLYGFMHDALRQAISNRYISQHGSSPQRYISDMLIHYFESKEVSDRQGDELLSALYLNGYDEKLTAFLQTAEQVLLLCKKNNNEFAKYWHVVKHKQAAAESLVRSLCDYQDENNMGNKERGEQNITVATALLISDAIDCSLRLFHQVRHQPVSKKLNLKATRGEIRVCQKKVATNQKEVSGQFVQHCWNLLQDIFQENDIEDYHVQAYDQLLYVELITLFTEKGVVFPDLNDTLKAVDKAIELFSEDSRESYESKSGIAQAMVVRLNLLQAGIVQSHSLSKSTDYLLDEAIGYLNSTKEYIEDNLEAYHPQRFLLQQKAHSIFSQRAMVLKGGCENEKEAWSAASVAAYKLYKMIEDKQDVFGGTNYYFLLFNALETISLACENGVSIPTPFLEYMLNATCSKNLSDDRNISPEVIQLADEIYRRIGRIVSKK